MEGGENVTSTLAQKKHKEKRGRWGMELHHLLVVLLLNYWQTLENAKMNAKKGTLEDPAVSLCFDHWEQVASKQYNTFCFTVSGIFRQ